MIRIVQIFREHMKSDENVRKSWLEKLYNDSNSVIENILKSNESERERISNEISQKIDTGKYTETELIVGLISYGVFSNFEQMCEFINDAITVATRKNFHTMLKKAPISIYLMTSGVMFAKGPDDSLKLILDVGYLTKNGTLKDFEENQIIYMEGKIGNKDFSIKNADLMNKDFDQIETLHEYDDYLQIFYDACALIVVGDIPIIDLQEII